MTLRKPINTLLLNKQRNNGLLLTSNSGAVIKQREHLSVPPNRYWHFPTCGQIIGHTYNNFFQCTQKIAFVSDFSQTYSASVRKTSSPIQTVSKFTTNIVSWRTKSAWGWPPVNTVQPTVSIVFFYSISEATTY
jgi:hypothetical protein